MNKQALIIVGVILLAAAILAARLNVGIDEPADELQTYCQNVANGVWPDYEGTYKVECGGKAPPKYHANLTK